jgi:hypothetical protein
MCPLSKKLNTKIKIDGLFINADGGFDCKELRAFCSNLEITPNIRNQS